jgi:hypothetical protein
MIRQVPSGPKTLACCGECNPRSRAAAAKQRRCLLRCRLQGAKQNRSGRTSVPLFLGLGKALPSSFESCLSTRVRLPALHDDIYKAGLQFDQSCLGSCLFAGNQGCSCTRKWFQDNAAARSRRLNAKSYLQLRKRALAQPLTIPVWWSWRFIGPITQLRLAGSCSQSCPRTNCVCIGGSPIEL